MRKGRCLLPGEKGGTCQGAAGGWDGSGVHAWCRGGGHGWLGLRSRLLHRLHTRRLRSVRWPSALAKRDMIRAASTQHSLGTAQHRWHRSSWSCCLFKTPKKKCPTCHALCFPVASSLMCGSASCLCSRSRRLPCSTIPPAWRATGWDGAAATPQMKYTSACPWGGAYPTCSSAVIMMRHSLVTQSSPRLPARQRSLRPRRGHGRARYSSPGTSVPGWVLDGGWHCAPTRSCVMGWRVPSLPAP